MSVATVTKCQLCGKPTTLVNGVSWCGHCDEPKTTFHSSECGPCSRADRAFSEASKLLDRTPRPAEGER